MEALRGLFNMVYYVSDAAEMKAQLIYIFIVAHEPSFVEHHANKFRYIGKTSRNTSITYHTAEYHALHHDTTTLRRAVSGEGGQHKAAIPKGAAALRVLSTSYLKYFTPFAKIGWYFSP